MRDGGAAANLSSPGRPHRLTATTGIIDAVCYLGIGHVLVANMTGNIVFLGLALAGAKGFSVSSFLVALGSFLVGATIGGRLGKVLDTHRHRWLTTTSVIQAGLAATAALAVAAGVLGPTGTARLWVIALLGAGTGVQNATIRRLAIPDLTTSVLTMTITGLAADSTLGGGDHPRRSRRLGSIAAMLIGALIGGALNGPCRIHPDLRFLGRRSGTGRCRVRSGARARSSDCARTRTMTAKGRDHPAMKSKMSRSSASW